MKKWEYKIKKHRHEGVAEINKLGEQGWELVAVTRDAEGYSYFYFKRPLE